MDLRNGKRKAEDFLKKTSKKRQLEENKVNNLLVEFGLVDEERVVVEEIIEGANKEVSFEKNLSIENLNLHLDNIDNSVLINEEDADPVIEDDENVSINSNDVSSLNTSFKTNSNSNKDNFEFFNESFDSIGNPELQSTKLPSTFPDFNSEEFVQLKENMPFSQIKTFDSIEDLDTFFRCEFPLTRFRHNQLVGCSECAERKSGHDMRKKISKCNCTNKFCNLQFKVTICQKSNKIKVYQRGCDIHNHKEMLKGDVAENASRKAKIMSNGIHLGYKKLFLQLLDDDQELSAMKMQVKVERGIKKGKINLPFSLRPSKDQVEN